ncbi:ZYBA0S03-07976g1_1 [Zygosaccharomyces bailii CLIB 213]|uniref:ZYBA0S03-07976g1_1 n=1 Tax=Zygosaccharomyces bailii (strain CLIB 213 / ATCC 58445 / CBS 680 / BCRC 21525 / NBRC 1098 / NCYC 1416 / NRRL Y-2227) TaxID=1333698 RepID=A0A8J2T876_ZYGB2|nr:ZYBA0S03-07976g1_1 [Zygosaccharomyces bailii CLIB 213]
MQAFKRYASTTPSQFRSVIYSSHSLEDAPSVLSVHRYTPKGDLSNLVVVRTLAFPINPSDVNQLQGVYPSKPEKTLDYGTEEPSAIAGNEGVFEVLSVPSHETSLKAGDWVIPLDANQGTWSDHRVFKNASDLIKVNGLDLYTAATIGVNGVTAYQLVHNYINWTGNNEWLIQNAGTSGVSKIVTQVAKAAGVKTLSVIRDRDNFEQVAKNLEDKFGATKVISESQNNDKVFGKQALPAILGKDARVRLALNSVGGKSSSSIARKLERDALMLTYGGMSKQPVTLPTSLHIFKGLTSKGFWVTENCRREPQTKIDAIRELIQLYKNGALVSPKDEIIATGVDPQASDSELLQAVRGGIKSPGKQVIVFKW